MCYETASPSLPPFGVVSAWPGLGLIQCLTTQFVHPISKGYPSSGRPIPHLSLPRTIYILDRHFAESISRLGRYPEILNLNRSVFFLSSLQPSLDNVDSVDSGHGTSAASSAGGAGGAGGGIIVAHPADRSAVVDCPSAASDVSLAHSSYVKIPPIDAFLASLTATTVSVSPPAADPAAAPAAESGSLSSPTFATFHPGRPSGGRSGGSPNNNGRTGKKFLGFHFLSAINLPSLSLSLSCRPAGAH